jgi:hypothetical protein
MRRGVLALTALAISIVVGAGCSSSGEDFGDPVYALYGARAETRLTPYPSNRWTRPDPTSKTGLRVDLRPETTNDIFTRDPTFANTVASLDRLDGFSTLGPFIINFSEEIVPEGSERGIALVDVDDVSPSRGRPMPVVTVYYTTTDSDATVSDYTLFVHPAEPLRPRTRYALVVGGEGIQAKSGVRVRATEETRALLQEGGEPGDYAQSVRRALPLVEEATGWKRGGFALATVFTTESVRDVVQALAVERRASPAPRLAAPFTVQQKGTAPDLRVRFVGRYDAPELRRPKPNGTWDVASEKPVVQSNVALETYLVFSDATKSGPRPIVIFGHGLGDDKDGTWGTAERLAELGVAVIGIDAPEHGSRSDPPTKDGKSDLFQSVTGFFAANPDTKTFDLEKVRDNFRQMASDQLELVRFINSLATLDLLPVGAPDGIPDLDVTKILYLGHSFGSVLGPTIGALAPEILAACWNVGGDGLTTLIRDSGLFSLFIDAFRPPGTPKSEVAKFFAITQAIMDPGDPANYARFATLEPLEGVQSWRAKDVLIQEVKEDRIVPNTSTEILARALGLVQVGPITHEVPAMARVAGPVTANLPSGATGGLVQYEVANGTTATHGDLIFSPEAKKQYVDFFRTALAGQGRATISP